MPRVTFFRRTSAISDLNLPHLLSNADNSLHLVKTAGCEHFVGCFKGMVLSFCEFAAFTASGGAKPPDPGRGQDTSPDRKNGRPIKGKV